MSAIFRASAKATCRSATLIRAGWRSIASNQITNAAFIGAVGVDWQFSGVGNFSGVPGETDLLLRNSTTGGLEVYDINNNQRPEPRHGRALRHWQRPVPRLARPHHVHDDDDERWDAVLRLRRPPHGHSHWIASPLRKNPGVISKARAAAVMNNPRALARNDGRAPATGAIDLDAS